MFDFMYRILKNLAYFTLIFYLLNDLFYLLFSFLSIAVSVSS